MEHGATGVVAAGRVRGLGHDCDDDNDRSCNNSGDGKSRLGRKMLVLILMQVVSWLSGRCGVRACSRLGKFELVYTLLVHAAGAVGGSRVVHIGVRRPRGRNVRIKLHVEFVVCVRVSAEGVAWALRRCMATKGLVIVDVI